MSSYPIYGNSATCHVFFVAITFTFSIILKAPGRNYALVHFKTVILNYRLVTIVADIVETVV